MYPELQVSGHNYAFPSDVREVGAEQQRQQQLEARFSAPLKKTGNTIRYKVDNEDLVHSTGKATQYSVMVYMGKESEKEWIYLCVQPIHLLYT